jgi:hypothetical protein
VQPEGKAYERDRLSTQPRWEKWDCKVSERKEYGRS